MRMMQAGECLRSGDQKVWLERVRDHTAKS